MKDLQLTVKTKERYYELCTTDAGVYAVSMPANAARIEQASRGMDGAVAAWLAGRRVVVQLVDGRYYLIKEFTPSAIYKAIAEGGSINASAAESWARTGANGYLSYEGSSLVRYAICSRCGAIYNILNGCGCVSKCRECGAVLRTAAEKKYHLCADCQKGANGRVYDYHRRQWGRRADGARFTYPKKRKDVLHAGIEVEIGGNEYEMESEDFARDCNGLVNRDVWRPLVEFERDGSIEGGVECITAALAWSEFCGIDWAKFYELAEENGGEFGSVNGVHFHIDRAFFGNGADLAAIKIETLIYKYFDFWKLASGRRAGNFGYACKKTEVNDFGSACVHASRRAHSFAVNTSGMATVELRIFGGEIATAEDLRACRDMAEAVAIWAKKSTIAAVLKATPSAIIKYLHEPANVARWIQKRLDSTTREACGDKDARAFIVACQKLGGKK